MRTEPELIQRSAIFKVLLLVNRRSQVFNFMYRRKELKVSLDVPVKCTRSADAPGFVLSSPNLQCYKRSVEYLGGKSWNGLSTELRPIPKCDELAKFKAHF